MNKIEIKSASNGWIVYWSEYLSRGPIVKIFTEIKDVLNYIDEIMSKK